MLSAIVTSKVNEGIEKQTIRLLDRKQKKDGKLQEKLQRIDSTKARELFTQVNNEYETLKRNIQSPPVLNSGIAQKLKNYIPRLDSLQNCALHFLQQKNVSIPGAKLDQESRNIVSDTAIAGKVSGFKRGAVIYRKDSSIYSNSLLT